MKKLGEDSFAPFVQMGDKVVEFTADWCPDCKRIEPDLPAIEDQFQNHYTFASLNVDEAPSIAEQYNVKGIPTFLIFKDGEEIGRLPSRDAKTKEQIESFLAGMSQKK
ncbi:thioredoxin family protein [Thermoflavimicrobium daqui]|jgi:thioredoxin-like negative regulator of GroEL|uniref:Thioredoxin n=1 Tax=Thermoflavimicrobium daqui TaxID=2137476 RepID=A0A364K551_9BACL|nr:thioredoxin family protein [Thermoflavimicrobium daqui]RAL24495.1 thiol reductase thioredoxin [Thermoflavimicrobium daqui]